MESTLDKLKDVEAWAHADIRQAETRSMHSDNPSHEVLDVCQALRECIEMLEHVDTDHDCDKVCELLKKLAVGSIKEPK